MFVAGRIHLRLMNNFSCIVYGNTKPDEIFVDRNPGGGQELKNFLSCFADKKHVCNQSLRCTQLAQEVVSIGGS